MAWFLKFCIEWLNQEIGNLWKRDVNSHPQTQWPRQWPYQGSRWAQHMPLDQHSEASSTQAAPQLCTCSVCQHSPIHPLKACLRAALCCWGWESCSISQRCSQAALLTEDVFQKLGWASRDVILRASIANRIFRSHQANDHVLALTTTCKHKASLILWQEDGWQLPLNCLL